MPENAENVLREDIDTFIDMISGTAPAEVKEAPVEPVKEPEPEPVEAAEEEVAVQEAEAEPVAEAAEEEAEEAEDDTIYLNQDAVKKMLDALKTTAEPVPKTDEPEPTPASSQLSKPVISQEDMDEIMEGNVAKLDEVIARVAEHKTMVAMNNVMAEYQKNLPIMMESMLLTQKMLDENP